MHTEASGHQVNVIVPEAARFAALKTYTVWQQLRSTVVLGLGLWFLVTVFALHLYLGARPHSTLTYLLLSLVLNFEVDQNLAEYNA